MNLENKVAVMAGATGGLGRVVSRIFAENGASLVLVGSKQEKLDQLVKDLNLSEQQYTTVVADLTQEAAAPKILKSALEKYKHVDILLNFVGGWIGGKSITDTSNGDLSSMIQQHLWTTFYLVRAFVPHMIANQWGRVMIVSAPSVAHPQANGLPYIVGKSAQEALMMTLAQELKDSGVTSNVLRVRAINTAQNFDQKTKSWATPEEITAAILYLCSEEAQKINGAIIPLLGS
jgi:dihydroxycyclohexadiene carboxylate dehydrogenase